MRGRGPAHPPDERSGAPRWVERPPGERCRRWPRRRPRREYRFAPGRPARRRYPGRRPGAGSVRPRTSRWESAPRPPGSRAWPPSPALEGRHGAPQAFLTYSKSNGFPLTPDGGGAIQLAILPGWETGFIKLAREARSGAGGG